MKKTRDPDDITPLVAYAAFLIIVMLIVVIICGQLP